jgi:MFS transporter, DHA2 family, methylenomycin A resistance protein
MPGGFQQGHFGNSRSDERSQRPVAAFILRGAKRHGIQWNSMMNSMMKIPRIAAELDPRRAHHPVAPSITRATARSQGRSPAEKALTLAAMSLGYVVVQLDVTIVNVAINAIGASLGGALADLQWIVNAYTITFASFILTAGALGDRIGAKRVFVLGFLIFVVASLGCALAPTLAVLVIARLCQGVGAAVLVPNSLALLNHAYPSEAERHRAVGIWAAGASLSLTAGPLLGGALIALIGWRSIFFINLPIGLVGMWLTWRYAGETPRRPARTLDLPGQATAVLALGALAAATIEGGQRGWLDPLVDLGFVAFVGLTALFLTIELRSDGPMLPLSLFRKPAFSATSLAGLLVNVGCYGLIFVFSLYFQQLNHMSPLATGVAFAPMMLAVLTTNLIAARVTNAIGARLTIAIGLTVVAASCIGLLWLRQGSSYWSLGPQLVALGGGLGLLVPPLTSTMLGSVAKQHSGVASGVLNAMRQTGSVLGVALFGSLLGSAGFIPGARISLAIAAAVSLGALAAVLVGVPKRRRA